MDDEWVMVWFETNERARGSPSCNCKALMLTTTEAVRNLTEQRSTAYTNGKGVMQHWAGDCICKRETSYKYGNGRTHRPTSTTHHRDEHLVHNTRLLAALIIPQLSWVYCNAVGMHFCIRSASLYRSPSRCRPVGWFLLILKQRKQGITKVTICS